MGVDEEAGGEANLIFGSRGRRRAGGTRNVPKDMQIPSLAKHMVEWINPQGSEEAATLVGALNCFIEKAKVRGWNPQAGAFVADPAIPDLLSQLRASLTGSGGGE